MSRFVATQQDTVHSQMLEQVPVHWIMLSLVPSYYVHGHSLTISPSIPQLVFGGDIWLIFYPIRAQPHLSVHPQSQRGLVVAIFGHLPYTALISKHEIQHGSCSCFPEGRGGMPMSLSGRGW